MWRAQIILLTAAGLGTVEITRRTGKSKNCVWRWQERFMQEGVEGCVRVCTTMHGANRTSESPKGITGHAFGG